MGEKIKPDFNNFVGFIFEDICIQKLKSLNKINKLSFKAKSVGRWWNGKDEIDLVAHNRKGSFIFCECKWTAKKVGISMLNKL